jgi:hypothetical protein
MKKVGADFDVQHLRNVAALWALISAGAASALTAELLDVSPL